MAQVSPQAGDRADHRIGSLAYVIRAAKSIILWIYDFLAEDTVLVLGMVIAVAATVLFVHITKMGAGLILWAVILVAIAVSLARTATVRS